MAKPLHPLPILLVLGATACGNPRTTAVMTDTPPALDATAQADVAAPTDLGPQDAVTSTDTATPGDSTSTDASPAERSPDSTSSPPGEGVPGGWSIQHTGKVNGAQFIHPVNTDKDGAIVASRIAASLGGLGIAATSDARQAQLNPTRMSDASYVDEAATFVVDELYGKLAQAGAPQQGLLTKQTLVLTSVHRYGLYVAEALHARVLPLQFISFAQDWSAVVAASTKASVIVGQDFDYGGLWLWNKLAAGAPGTPAGQLPTAYLKALAEATSVVIVQPNDNWATCTASYCWDVVHETYTGGPSPIYLHTSLTKSGASNAGTALYAEAKSKSLVVPTPDAEVGNLKQWEWGVPDSTIVHIQAAWAALGKPPSQLKVIRGGVVDMFAWTPKLWQAYLAKNSRKPRGIHISSYWVAPTALERAGSVLPFPAYSFWQDAWHPLDDNARALLTTVCGGATCPADFAANSRAFVNNIGSAGDKLGVRKVLIDFGLTQDNGAYFGFGINAQGAGSWTGWTDEPVPTAWEQAATAVQNPDRAPYAGQPWQPLTVGEVCGLGLYACE